MKKQRLNTIKKKIENNKFYTLSEALEFYSNCYIGSYQAKFDESVECIIRLGVRSLKPHYNVRGNVVLPYSLKKNRLSTWLKITNVSFIRTCFRIWI